MTEENWNLAYTNTCKLFQEVLERIFSKTIDRANNKEFAKKYFLEYLEAELDFHKGFPFNTAVLDYFQISYNLGSSWANFFREVRVLQKIHTYNIIQGSLNEYAKLHNEFTSQEIKRIALEARIMDENLQCDGIYKSIHCALLHKCRNIDFVRYVAKHKILCSFVRQLRKSNEINDVNNTKSIRKSNEAMLWNTGKGKKIELIRLLVALNDCKYFEIGNGLAPSQEQLMNYFSEILSVNLKHYEQDLSNGFESKLQTNTALFDKLKMAIEKRYYQKVEQN